MGERAPEADQQDTRARILAAARELFAEHGYSGASISKIAKQADVLPGSIYWAFASKEALFATVLTESAEEWRRKYSPAANDQSPTIATFRDGILLFASGFTEGPEFLRLLMVVATEHKAGAAEIQRAAVHVRRVWRDAMEGTLRAELADYDPTEVRALASRISRLVLQLLDGVFMSLQIERTEESAHSLVADAADVVQRELQFGLAQLRRS